MGCVSPNKAYQLHKVNPETGKYPVTFRKPSGDYLRELELPCGKCAGCSWNRRSEWAVRCFHEAALFDRNSFVTLTFDDEHCPEEVSPRDLQLFFKKLRKRGEKVRYFACGEYGTHTKRPHYHVLFFGHDFLGGGQSVLEQVWGQGHVRVDPFNMGAACYVAGYIAEKVDNPGSFQVMSRRPGIGSYWLDKFSDDIARNDGIVVVEGREYPIPRRYLNWKELEFKEVIESRREYQLGLSFEERVQRVKDRKGREAYYKARALQRKTKI